MKYLPLLFLVACIPEPVSLPQDNGIQLPLRVCNDDRAIVGQAIKHVNAQMRGAIVRQCPGNVTIDLQGSEVRTGGVAIFDHGNCHIILTRVDPEARSWVLAHELGHCLGLEDDVGFNTQMSDPYFPAKMPSDRFSDRDRRYVEERLHDR